MPSWIDFELAPIRQLDQVPGQPRVWRVNGNDPQFACQGAPFPLRAGWYRMELEIAHRAGPMLKPALYPDYGPDVSPDPAGIFLSFVRRGSSQHAGIVRFTHDVHGLRFDPAVCPCDFSLGGLRLCPVGRPRVLAHLLSARIAAQPRVGGRLRVLAAAAKRLFTGGLHGLAQWLYDAYARDSAPQDTGAYEAWVALYDAPTDARLAQARERQEALSRTPLFSVLVPTWNTDPQWLRRCIESVKAQVYPHWELCIADDASTRPQVLSILREYAADDARIHIVARERNGHISATSNSALAMARGDYVVLLDHDDELHPLALHEVALALDAHPDWRVIYSDEDKIDAHGCRHDPYMKPDWNPDLFLSHNCISHLGVYQRALVNAVGGFREGYEGSQDWDLALRCIERLASAQIGHIPKVLYHWRAIPGSTALAPQEKDYAHQAGLRAVNEHLARTGVDAAAEAIPGRRGHFRVRYRLPTPAPRISLVIPTRDGLHLLRRCVDSILRLTTYPDYEILIVDNQSREPTTLAYLRAIQDDPRVRVLPYDKPFNYSALNNVAVAHTQGELIGLVNNDIELITPDWLEEMAGHAMRPEIGAVGAMLYYPNNTIQHAGVILGVGGVAAHAYCGQPKGHMGQMGRARLAQTLSAVTAACVLVRREVFDEVGGLDETLRVAFNDIDFCLRVRKAGYRNLWTPFAELYHHESATRGYEDSPEKKARFQREVEQMITVWGDALTHDPAYSPNLTLTGAPFELAYPPMYEK